jgi:hypothetical protein
MASSTTIPLGRWASAMAYDGKHHGVLLFGGLNGRTLLGDTWTWNGSIWTHRQALTATPQARQGAAMAFDEVSGHIVLFGGYGQTGQLGDTWAWDGAAWQELRPSHNPSARQGASMVYDPALKAIVLYGGLNTPGGQPVPINDTWTWTGSDWAQQQPAASPPGGEQPRLAFLTGANLVERLGDCRDTHDRSLYAFDGRTWSAIPATGTWPPGLCLPSLAGDAGRRQLVLFGGTVSAGALQVTETWSYDGATWKKATPPQSPSARFDAPMVYDPDQHRMVLFGGQGLGEGQSGPLNDTWTWDGTSWTLHQ